MVVEKSYFVVVLRANKDKVDIQFASEGVFDLILSSSKYWFCRKVVGITGNCEYGAIRSGVVDYV